MSRNKVGKSADGCSDLFLTLWKKKKKKEKIVVQINKKRN